MNRSLLASISLGVLAAGFAPLRAQEAASSLFEKPTASLDDDGPLSEPRHIRLGLTPDEVWISMKGKPDVTLTPEIWVYWDFRGGGGRFDTLVVTFARGQVRQFRLVERKAMLALIEQLRRIPSPPDVVAKK